MKITIKATNTKLSPSIHQYVEEKIGGLERFLGNCNPDLVDARIELSKFVGDQRQGEIFKAEVNLSAEGELIRAEETGESLTAAIDLVKDALAREIKRSKNKRMTQFIRGARSWKKFWRITPLARYRKSRASKILRR